MYVQAFAFTVSPCRFHTTSCICIQVHSCNSHWCVSVDLIPCMFIMLLPAWNTGVLIHDMCITATRPPFSTICFSRGVFDRAAISHVSRATSSLDNLAVTNFNCCTFAVCSPRAWFGHGRWCMWARVSRENQYVAIHVWSRHGAHPNRSPTRLVLGRDHEETFHLNVTTNLWLRRFLAWTAW